MPFNRSEVERLCIRKQLNVFSPSPLENMVIAVYWRKLNGIMQKRGKVEELDFRLMLYA